MRKAIFITLFLLTPASAQDEGPEKPRMLNEVERRASVKRQPPGCKKRGDCKTSAEYKREHEEKTPPSSDLANNPPAAIALAVFVAVVMGINRKRG